MQGFGIEDDRKRGRLTALLKGQGRWWAVAGLAGMVGAGGLLGGRPSLDAPSSPASDPVAVTVSEDANVLGVSTSWDLPNLDHPRVDYWVERFSTDAEMRAKFEGFLRRSGWYRDMISRRLAAREMPQDLLYLSMIESGFQPHAYSPAAASGLWQFIAETGRRYGLEIDGYVDERNHPERATEAALDYLQELHDRFDSWYLAAAAYNTGENRIGRIMREEFGTEKAFGEGAYYRIWNRLPRETRDYVPLMIAAARITKDPAAHGFAHVAPEAPLRYDEVVTDAALDFREIAEAAGVAEDQVELLNPFLNGRTPGDRRIAVRLPPGSGAEFEQNWARFVGSSSSARPGPTSVYRVRRGDNLTVIAHRVGTSVDALRRMNGLRGDRIYVGQNLRVGS